MTTLHQILAVEKGVGTQAHTRLTEIHRLSQKEDLMTGIARSYQPRDDEGEHLPSETKHIQVYPERLLEEAAKVWTRHIDVTATRDYANMEAAADVVVDGIVLMEDAPTSFLLWLEKKLVDVRTVIEKIPTTSSAEKWNWNTAAGCWAAELVKTVRTKKVPKNHVKYEATEKHPAQVEMYYEDVVVGDWTTAKTSSALSPRRKAELLERTNKLLEAVKVAKQEANQAEVDDQSVGAALFEYLLQD